VPSPSATRATPTRSSSSCYSDQKYRGANVGQAAFQGGGTLFTEPILVVNQKAKLIELNNQYSVFNKDGQQLAAVNQVGQNAAKKALRLLTSLDQFLTHKLEITDGTGQVVLRITRPAKVMKSTVIVSDANDQEIGRIVQDNVFGKIHFTLQAGGHTYGAIKAENWRAWNFRIEDHTGQESRPHHQDVRGHRQDHVHQRGQLRRADPRADPAAAQLARRRCCAVGRHRVEAGLARLRLISRRPPRPPTHARWRSMPDTARCR
jgi:hypothetical protein